MVWIIVGTPNFSELYATNVLIDVNSGDVRVEQKFGRLLVYGRTTRTAFSQMVRHFRLETQPASWMWCSAKYYPSGMREDFQYTGAVQECQLAVKYISDHSMDEQDRKQFLVRCLRLLKGGAIKGMHNENER